MITINIRKSDKCNGEFALFVSFPYNIDIINMIRGLSGRYWHKDTKQWEIPANKYNTLIEWLNSKSYELTVIGDTSLLNSTDKTPAHVHPDFQFKTPPFEHQLDGFNYGLTHDRWLLGDEQGLGKTKQAIDIAVQKKLERGYEHCLIVCGVNGLKWNWVNEIKTHSNEDVWILGQRMSGRTWKIGGSQEKLNDIEDIHLINAYFIVTNVETLRNEKIALKLQTLCKNGVIGIVVIDEIHKCKNPSSQQGKGILKLQSEIRIAMTGTPLMNTPLDLFIILKWLGYEKHAFYAFKNHYCVMGGYGGYEVIGYRNLNELQEQLDTMMLRRKKEDVLHLPEKIYINEFVEMTPRQEQIYKEVSAEIRANIDRIKMSNNPLAELLRMRQATSFTGILSSNVRESAKLDRLEELVDEAIANERKVIIFSNWTQVTAPANSRLAKKYKGVVITGETGDAERQVCVNHFQTNPDCKYIIGTIGAMGTGLTLTAGTIVIFLDEPWTMANKQQAIDRCHRIGTTSSITVYTLMCKGTIDERIHDIVEKKGLMSDVIIDGKIVGDKAQLVDFLLS